MTAASSDSPPGLLLESDEAISTARRSGAVARKLSRHSRAASLLTVPRQRAALAEGDLFVLVRENLVEHVDGRRAIERDAGHDGVDPGIGADFVQRDLRRFAGGRRGDSFRGRARCRRGGRILYWRRAWRSSAPWPQFMIEAGSFDAAGLGGRAGEADKQHLFRRSPSVRSSAAFRAAGRFW